MIQGEAIRHLPPKVLVVDDDRRLLGAISTRLEILGCRCTNCDNANEAIAQFSRGGFDLIITDLTMPGVDGFSVVGLIRSQSNVPIIVVTGHADEYEALINGFANVTLIRKPFEMRALMIRVHAELAFSGHEVGS